VPHNGLMALEFAHGYEGQSGDRKLLDLENRKMDIARDVE